jgi:hypothetical protein
MKPKMQFIVTCVGLVIAAGLALWAYESSKITLVTNTTDAIVRARDYARSHFELKTENPCLARPEGIVNINGQTMDQWQVCFPISDWSAASYQVYSNGRVINTNVEFDMLLAALKYNANQDDTYTNWSPVIKEKLKKIEETKKHSPN